MSEKLRFPSGFGRGPKRFTKAEPIPELTEPEARTMVTNFLTQFVPPSATYVDEETYRRWEYADTFQECLDDLEDEPDQITTHDYPTDADFAEYADEASSIDSADELEPEDSYDPLALDLNFGPY